MKILSHTVKPKIPPALSSLEEMAHNLWLSWNFEAITLFMRLDYDVWLQSNQNPAMMLGMVAAGAVRRACAGRFVHRRAQDGRGEIRALQERRVPGTKASTRASWPISRWSTGSTFPSGLFRGPRHPLRRPYEGRERHGPSSGGRGPPLSTGLLQAVPQPGRFPAGILSGERLVQYAPSTVASTQGKPILISVEMAGKVVAAQSGK